MLFPVKGMNHCFGVLVSKPEIFSEKNARIVNTLHDHYDFYTMTSWYEVGTETFL